MKRLLIAASLIAMLAFPAVTEARGTGPQVICHDVYFGSSLVHVCTKAGRLV